jgi:hypothetical protein
LLHSSGFQPALIKQSAQRVKQAPEQQNELPAFNEPLSIAETAATQTFLPYMT